MLQDVLLALQLTNEAVGAFWTDLSVLVDTSLQKPDVLWKKRMTHGALPHRNYPVVSS